MYVDEIEVHNDYKIVKSKLIDDGVWNFVYDIKAKNYKDFINKFNQSKKLFTNREPRFYLLQSDESAKYLRYFNKDFHVYCKDTWFSTPLSKLNLNHVSEIDVEIEISNNKQEIIDCIMEAFTTHDPNDPYGDLSSTYKESLNKKLFDKKSKYLTLHYIAKHNGKGVSISGITIKNNNAYLNNVATLKEFRGKNISKAILTSIIKDLKASNIQNIVFATETAAYTESYYKKLGFDIVEYGYCFEEKPLLF